jgi:hypothetical protein
MGRALDHAELIIPRGYLHGLTLSPNGTNTFGVNAGEASDRAFSTVMSNPAAVTKTNGAWAAGSAAGALDTGAIAASTWYHAHQIKRMDTGAVDFAISLNPTAPSVGTNIPSIYTVSRRLASMKTDASNNFRQYTQFGDHFLWTAPLQDFALAGPGTAPTVRQLVNIPTGVVTMAVLDVMTQISNPTSVQGQCSIYPTDGAAGPNQGVGEYFGAAGVMAVYQQVTVKSDVNAQIMSVHVFSDVNVLFRVSAMAWFDYRGRQQ